MTWIPSKPATQDDVSRLQSLSEYKLPAAYLTFLSQVGGGEGDLQVEPGWIQFWSPESVLDLNREYEVNVSIPGFFGFGSSGGGELLAFDMRGGGEPPVVMVPFIPMTASEAQPVAQTFEQLLSYLCSEPPTKAAG